MPQKHRWLSELLLFFTLFASSWLRCSQGKLRCSMRSPLKKTSLSWLADVVEVYCKKNTFLLIDTFPSSLTFTFINSSLLCAESTRFCVTINPAAIITAIYMLFSLSPTLFDEELPEYLSNKGVIQTVQEYLPWVRVEIFLPPYLV